MEYALTEESNVPVEITELKDTESTEKFQKFIHELFEKNGVLNDLRAYLRGHIVDVLKSAETGDPTLCHKNFTERLELTCQAMNILIAEYLLRLEFNYTLSVFTSEIPLSNMVFKFSKSLLNAMDSAISGLRFGDGDIWSILNYLGIKCDSEHASKIVEVYKSQTSYPLLWCILKCIPMYQKPVCIKQVDSSDESCSEDLLGDKVRNAYRDKPNKCRHYIVCKVCQDRVLKLKEKYKRKKVKLEENEKTSEINALNVETFMKNVGILEQSLIDEMFQQLKTVYEAEVDMIRVEKDTKIRRSIANHALQLQKYREQLEESFAARQSELEESVRKRQSFLCNVARRLANAQAQLSEEENNLKTQLQDAEETLKTKSEEMKDQITEELNILQSHLKTIKRERDDIDRERDELKKLRETYNNNNILKDKYMKENEDIKLNYNLLKDEIIILRKYMESKSAKCLVEKGTETDIVGVKSLMNNGHVGGTDDDRLKVRQVVNDLKKYKNVNFSQTILEDMNMERNRQRSATEETKSDMESIAIQQLKEENERLIAFAKQQSEHIERLSTDRQRLQDEIHKSRPKTAPSVMCNSNYLPHSTVNLYPNELGVQSRVLFPGDAVPFIGVLRGRRSDDSRRRLLSKWREQRCPKEPYTQPSTSTVTTRGADVTNKREIDSTTHPIVCEKPAIPKPTSPVKSEKREKSPTTDLRKAKQKLKNSTKKDVTSNPREKSPNATLREAKLRLRKLEIEAEAVQRSYLEYRRKQVEMRGERENLVLADETVHVVKELDKNDDNSLEKIDSNYKDGGKFVYKESPEKMKKDFDKYFREYQNINTENSHFHNLKSVIEKIKPIPDSYSKVYENEEKNNNIDYLETPLIEFRKLYQTDKSKTRINEKRDFKRNNNLNKNDNTSEQNSPILVANVKSDIQTELEIQENYGENNKQNTDLLLETEKDIPKTIIEESKNDIVNHIENKVEILNEYLESKLNILEINKSERTIEEIKDDTPKDNASSLTFEINNQQSEIDIEKEAKGEIIDIVAIEEQKYNIEIENEDKMEQSKNVLMVEVENVRATTNIGVTESNQDLLVVVESSIDTKELVLCEIENTKEVISTQMTIIVSPKQDSVIKDIEDKIKNLSPEITKLSENDALNAIYHSDANKLSSVDMDLDLNKLDINSDGERDIQDYQDDFSADVDNYNSRSDYGKNSPISLPKTSEDENFWDS